MDIITKEIPQIPKWTMFEIKSMKKPDQHHSSFIMGDYLVVVVLDWQNDLKGVNRPKLDALAFSLLDHSVQEADVGFLSPIAGIGFVKYDENRIICYQYSSWKLTYITVESFQPLKVKLEEIQKKDPSVYYGNEMTAQVYRDSLYFYGSASGQMKTLSYNLSMKAVMGSRLVNFIESHKWKLCKTAGEAPEGHIFRSFIHGDNLYIYSSKRYVTKYNLFMLNLNEMKWTLIKQPKKYIESDCYKSGRAVYKDHLVFLENPYFYTRVNSLCFFDLNTKDKWRNFDTEGILVQKLDRQYPDLLIYKNLISSLAFKNANGKNTLVVIMMSLDRFRISAPKSAEEERISSLFLSERESDITFRVGDLLIFGHKQVLVEKSRYFAGLIEDKQGIIEIQDCESDVFKEYLRFVYQNKVNFYDTDLLFKLHSFANQYTQEDLSERCVELLSHNLNDQNVYKILDYAKLRNIPYMKSWCLNFIETYLNESNVVGLIEYLDRQEDSLSKDNKKLRNDALNVIFYLFFDIYEDKEGNIQVFTSFLLKNVEIDTLPAFAYFLSNYEDELEERKRECLKKTLSISNGGKDEETENYDEDSDDDSEDFDGRGNEDKDNENKEDDKRILEEVPYKTEGLLEEIGRIKEATLSFIYENVKTLLTNDIPKELMDFVFASLFMNQIGSDIYLKVEGQLIPAHKQILVKKSRYFERVFNSGMAESKQDVIDVSDCEYDIFKEYLRFIYQGIVHLENSQKTIKVHTLADKYLQEDLCEECIAYLTNNIKEDNVYEILDFAHEKNLPYLRKRCIELFKKDANIDTKTIEYLGRRRDDFECNEELRDVTLAFIVKNLFYIYETQKDSFQVYENFLLENIGMDTISLFANFLSRSYELFEGHNEVVSFSGIKTTCKRAQELFIEATTKLKEGIFDFIHENIKEAITKQILATFSSNFLTDFAIYLADKSERQIQDLMTKCKCSQAEMSQNEEKKGSGKKRMEPSQDGTDEENPVLKKTKQ